MQRNPKRRRLGGSAERFHIEWTIVIDRNNSLPRIDRFADGVGDLVRHPAMRDQRPAAEIDRLDIRAEPRIFSGRNQCALVAHLLQLLESPGLDGKYFEIT